MKKERRVVDKKKNIVQCTEETERFYQINGKYVPSVTHILSALPTSYHLIQWISDRGLYEANKQRDEAGKRGTNVHDGIERLISGEELYHTQYSIEEWKALESFIQWDKDTKPKYIKTEFIVHNKWYAGTVDLLCEIDGERWIVDFKTSKAVYPSMGLQLSAYKKALRGAKNYKIAVLLVGKSTKKGYYFKEMEYNYDVFKHVMAIWDWSYTNKQPKEFDLPVTLKI